MGEGGWGKVETINAIGFFHIKMTAENFAQKKLE